MTFVEDVQATRDLGQEFLEHYGIPGMKWGRRRSSAELARLRSLPDAEDHRRARQLQTTAKVAGTRKLTNKDLDDLNKRLNLEQNYSNLTNKPKQKAGVAKGASWMASKILKIGDMATDEVARAHTRVYLHQRGLLPQVPKGAKNDD